MPWPAVIVFIVVAYGLAWLVALPLWVSETLAASPFAQLIIMAMMFTPAIGALVVLFGLRTPRESRLRFLGMWPLRPGPRIIWFSVAALLGPGIITAASVAIAALFGWVTLDLHAFSGFEAQLRASTPPEALSTLPPTGVLVALQVALIPLGGIMNALPAFGEELGWRGWLLPALRPLGTWPALLISGAIWGLWHTPVTLLGHNYGLTDWRGVALMLTACIGWGILFGWLRLRTGSIWPAVFAHGALNSAAGLILLVAAQNPEPDFVLGNVMGVAGWIALAIVIAALAITGQFRHQPSLAAHPAHPAHPAQPAETRAA